MEYPFKYWPLAKYVHLLRVMHLETETSVQVNGRCSMFVPTRTGVRQGFSVASEQFNCIIDHVMVCMTQKLSFRLKCRDIVVTDCEVTDNIALVAHSKSATYGSEYASKKKLPGLDY